MNTILLIAIGIACRADAQTCNADASVGLCPFRGCFVRFYGPSVCRSFHCHCKPGYCAVNGKRPCVPDNSSAQVHDTSAPTPVPAPTPVQGKRKTALLVIGTDPNLPLYADAIFKKRLEHHGFHVTLIIDHMATDVLCEKFDVMLVSASINGNAVKHSLDNCSSPSMHWEMGLWLYNGMTGLTMGVDAWITHENRFARVPRGPTGAWPPRPQGGNIFITQEGAGYGELAAGQAPGTVPFFEDYFYGMNWASVDSLGKGAKVVAVLPMPTAPHPEQKKAVLFYYPKGAPLYGNRGLSPGLRIGFTPFHYAHGTDPSCEELTQAQQVCNGCTRCHTAAEMEVSVNPMPLTEEGLAILDNAIHMLKEAALAGELEQSNQLVNI